MAKGDILAVSGDDYLVDAGTGEFQGIDDVRLGRVFSRVTGGYLGSEAFPVESILARGYWEATTGVPDVILDGVRAAVAAL